MIDYLILKRGYSKQEALATVGWCSTDGSYTSLSIQIQRGRIGVLLDQAIHSSGRLLEYFFPRDVHLANTSMSEKGN